MPDFDAELDRKVIGCRTFLKDFSKVSTIQNKESDEQTIIMDPHFSEKPDPDPHEAINVRSRIRICILVKNRIRIRIKEKSRSSKS